MSHIDKVGLKLDSIVEFRIVGVVVEKIATKKQQPKKNQERKTISLNHL
jgi:hypothetical protein